MFVACISASDAIDSKFPVNVVLYNTGLINWVPLGLYTSSCDIDITWFPFDDQKCTLKFGSWTYDGYKINLTSMHEKIDMSTYKPNGEWNIIGMLDISIALLTPLFTTVNRNDDQTALCPSNCLQALTVVDLEMFEEHRSHR